MKKKPIEWKLHLRILLSIILLYAFYLIGFSWYVLLLIGSVIFLLIFLRGKIYRKIDSLISKIFPFLSKQKPRIKRVIIIALFILSYLALKQIIFLILRLVGIDFQTTINDEINKSVLNNYVG